MSSPRPVVIRRPAHPRTGGIAVHRSHRFRSVVGVLLLAVAPAALAAVDDPASKGVPAPIVFASGFEGCFLVYRDLDADGFGDPDAVLATCDAVPGYVDIPFDCDDGDIDANPEAFDEPELAYRDTNCDGIDGDIADSVFVAPDGAMTGGLSPSAPIASLAGAFVLAQDAGRHWVLLSGGPYALTFAPPPEGLHLAGGYLPGFAERDATRTAMNVLSQGLLLDGWAMPTRWQQIALYSADAGEPGGSSFVLRVSQASGLVLENVELAAGNGAAGTGGEDGDPGDPGLPGGNGSPGCENDGMFGCGECTSPLRGQGGGSVCGLGGGRGGFAGVGTQSGSSGASVLGGGQGGSGGLTDGDGTQGGDGADGSAGSSGAAGVAGVFDESGYATATALAGTSGTAGNAGGGGGGGGGGDNLCDSFGSSGGGGGSGGCGGAAGQGGQGGGASIALLLVDAQVQVIGGLLRSGNAGDGGAGGSGGDGGQGGNPGSGGPYNPDEQDDAGEGADGGSGGDGGMGGQGGGGAGGPVAAVRCEGASQLDAQGTALQVGAPGQGGLPNGTIGSAEPLSGC